MESKMVEEYIKKRTFKEREFGKMGKEFNGVTSLSKIDNLKFNLFNKKSMRSQYKNKKYNLVEICLKFDIDL
jgi:hypothetical protein